MPDLTPKMAEEVELKFAISEPHTDLVRMRLPHAKRGRGARMAHKRLRSVYYDTPELALRRRGIGLRVRRVDGRWLQTLSCDGTAGRLECEHEIKSDRPDFTCIEETGLQDVLAALDAAARLKPMFATEIDRTAWEFHHRGAAIGCALDVGEIRAGGKRLPIRELDLELKAGPASSLFETADALNRQLGLRLEWESKSQRGYALSAGVVPEPPPRTKLSRKMTTRAAFATIVGDCVGRIAFYAPLVRRDGAIEDVHQMRVAVRGLRAALSTFRRAMRDRRLDFEEDLRWLQDKLGVVRDWDVFQESAVRPIEPKAGDVALVETAGAGRRAEAYRDLCQALDSPRTTSLWLAITRWLRSLAQRGPAGGKLDWPIAKYARRELRRRARKLGKRGRRIAELDEAALHKLRIGAKKLRYAAEFFRDLLPRKGLRKAVSRMKAMQDLLGALNDARTARRLLARVLPRSGGRPEVALAHGEGVVEGAVLARVSAEHEKLAHQWSRYDKLKKPWD